MNNFWKDFINGINDGLIYFQNEKIKQNVNQVIDRARKQEIVIINSYKSIEEKQLELQLLYLELKKDLEYLNSQHKSIELSDFLNKLSKELK